MVFSYVELAYDTSMRWRLDGKPRLIQYRALQDELKLLRLRTKNQEFVIVPEPKYLLVVVHDTPLA